MKTPNQTEQLQNDIAYCIDEYNLSNEMEEFVFEGGDCEKYDDINYLNIAEFNSLYWEQ